MSDDSTTIPLPRGTRDDIIHTPVVGCGATTGYGGDCYPHTVIEVGKTKAVLRADHVDARGDLSPNQWGRLTTVTKRTDGTWRVQGQQQYATFGIRWSQRSRER